jgi:hypothetical protein
MMRFQAGRFVAAVAPLVLLAACASEPPATVVQNDRMQARLAPEIAGSQLSVSPLPGGTQVAIPDQALFQPGSAKLSDKGRFVLTYVIQALLEPKILSIGVADASDSLQVARAQTVADYFSGHSLGPQLQPLDAPPPVVPVGPAGTPLQGVSVTVNVVSPT